MKSDLIKSFSFFFFAISIFALAPSESFAQSLFGNLYNYGGISDQSLVNNLDSLNVIIENPSDSVYELRQSDKDMLLGKWNAFKDQYRAKLLPGGGGLSPADREVLDFWFQNKLRYKVNLTRFSKMSLMDRLLGGAVGDNGSANYVTKILGLEINQAEANIFATFKHETGHLMTYEAAKTMQVYNKVVFSPPEGQGIKQWYMEMIANAMEGDYSFEYAASKTADRYYNFIEAMGREGLSSAQIDRISKLAPNQAFAVAQDMLQQSSRALRSDATFIDASINRALQYTADGKPMFQYEPKGVKSDVPWLGRLAASGDTDAALIDYLSKSILANSSTSDGLLQYRMQQMMSDLKTNGLTQLQREVLQAAKQSGKQINVLFTKSSGLTFKAPEILTVRYGGEITTSTSTMSFSENFFHKLSVFREMELSKVDGMAYKALNPDGGFDDFYKVFRKMMIATNGDASRAIMLARLDANGAGAYSTFYRNLEASQRSAFDLLSDSGKAEILHNIAMQPRDFGFENFPAMFDNALRGNVPQPPVINGPSDRIPAENKNADGRAKLSESSRESSPTTSYGRLSQKVLDMERAEKSAVRKFFDPKLGVLRTAKSVMSPVSQRVMAGADLGAPIVAGLATALGYLTSGGYYTWDEVTTASGEAVREQVRQSVTGLVDLAGIANKYLGNPMTKDIVNAEVDVLKRVVDKAFDELYNAIDDENRNPLINKMADLMAYDSATQAQYTKLKNWLKNAKNKKLAVQWGYGKTDCGLAAGKKPNHKPCDDPNCGLPKWMQPANLVCSAPPTAPPPPPTAGPAMPGLPIPNPMPS